MKKIMISALTFAVAQTALATSLEYKPSNLQRIRTAVALTISVSGDGVIKGVEGCDIKINETAVRSADSASGLIDAIEVKATDLKTQQTVSVKFIEDSSFDEAVVLNEGMQKDVISDTVYGTVTLINGDVGSSVILNDGKTTLTCK